MTQRIVIIGGGPAGYEAALAGTKYGADITLIEEQGSGGSAVLFDCVPSKTFISTIKVKTDLRRADDFHLVPSGSGKNFSLEAANKRVLNLAQAQSDDVSAKLKNAGVRIIDGHAEFADYERKQLTHYIKVTHRDGTDETIECDLVLVATGASPRVLPGAVPDGERIFDWRQIYSLTETPEHLIVVGSGVTGAEFVSAFAEMGVKVTMVASRDRILPHDDADAADTLEEVLGEQGVSLEKHARVDKVTNTGDGVVVTTADGREIRGSHALMTVGSVPNTKEVGLERVGVELTDSGHIKVDRVSRTSVTGVYAAGDCTNLFPLASVAAMQGRIAMYHALGEVVPPIRLKTVASAVFTRPEIAAVGVSQAQVDRGEITARVIKLPLSTNPRAKMRALRHGFVKLYCRRNSGLVIGGVVVAPSASELILPITLAVNHNLTVADIADTFSVYPTLSGSITEAARQLVQHDDLE